jgi:protein-S-isoprenylcysteine O-methyltransferase Ste14
MRHLRAILLLPGMVTLVVPALVVRATGFAPLSWPRTVAALVLVGIGLSLMVRTIRLFATVGQGTLAPWDPTAHLVVRDVYRHVRNPMISGVLFILLGEATFFDSRPLLVWFGLFFLANAIYFPLVEEPGLVRRFGAEYERYRANVPRWIPRLAPWEDGGEPKKP